MLLKLLPMRSKNKQSLLSRLDNSLSNNSIALRTLVFLIFVLVVLSILYVNFKTDLVRITDVNVIGRSVFVNLTDVETLATQHAFGNSLLFYNKHELEEILLDYFQGAKEIKIEKNLPNKLTVNIFERTPVALIYTKDTTDYFVVDSDGYILGVVDESRTNLTRIEYDKPLKVGEFIDPNSANLFDEVVTSFDAVAIRISKISINFKDINIHTPEGSLLVISRDKSISESAKLLAEIMKKLNSEGSKVKSVDLRFEKVIVSYD